MSEPFFLRIASLSLPNENANCAEYSSFGFCCITKQPFPPNPEGYPLGFMPVLNIIVCGGEFKSLIKEGSLIFVKSDFKADTCPAFHIPLLRYAEYMFPLASIANKAPSVESPVFIKANLEYAGIEKELPIEIGVFPITPKQLPLDGKSVNEL